VQFAPLSASEPPSLPGVPQTLIGSDGAVVSAPHVAPGMKHSAAREHTWRKGHGPAWQFVDVFASPQHTWPGRQPAALVHLSLIHI